MKSLLTTLLVLLTCLVVHAQSTNGTALLQNQTDHSGITVKFTAVSPSGQTDSVMTDSAGNYSITLANGIYTVDFSKTGFLSIPYQNGNLLVLGASTTTLATATLPIGNYKAVEGDVSGIWYPDTIYLVTKNVLVPGGQSLTILPGTEVAFDGNYSLSLQGDFTAVGTELEPILFTLSPSATVPYWDNIGVAEHGPVGAFTLDTARFQHCIIEFATSAVIAGRYQPGDPIFFDFQNNLVRNSEHTGILVSGRVNSVIMGNEFEMMSGTAISVQPSDSSFADVQCNNIHNVGGIGISSFGNQGDLLVASNYVHDMPGSHTFGLRIQPAAGTTIVRNNLVENVGIGINEASHTVAHLTVNIHNNQVNNCTHGIQFGAVGAGAFEMNVVRNCSIAFFQPSWATNAPLTVSYNSLWNNTIDFQDVMLPGLGNIVTTNNNGDPVDLWFNLFLDPEINSPNTYYPAPTSPLINAGNPADQLDPDNSIADIGLRQVYVNCTNLPELGTRLPTSAEGLEPAFAASTSVFPNPTNGRFRVESDQPIEWVELWSLDGRRLELREGQTGAYDVDGYPAGIYLLRIQTVAGLESRKLLLQ